MKLRPGFEHFERSAVIVVCPHCGNNCTHQHSVEVFFREEDALNGTHVEVDINAVRTDRVMYGNPSRRRSGLRLWLSCEGCGGEFPLTIVQHKGQTFVNGPDL